MDMVGLSEGLLLSGTDRLDAPNFASGERNSALGLLLRLNSVREMLVDVEKVLLDLPKSRNEKALCSERATDPALAE